MITVYRVTVANGEFRYPSAPPVERGMFTTKQDADAFAQALRYEAHIRKYQREVTVSAVNVLESIDEYEPWKKERLRREAAAKLTHEEREALGI